MARPTIRPPTVTAENLYDRVAEEAASLVIRNYSTSFGLASRLLEPTTRRHVENIYALVRVADEIVDGGAADAGLDPAQATKLLDDFERDTSDALELGYSSNLVIHAFARTARETGFGDDLVRPFFDSMRMDLSSTEYDDSLFERYIYGSAEVVGLMCLRAFVFDKGLSPEQEAELVIGARRLGAAFQKVNFLRDLQADFELLGRSYFPGIVVETFCEEDKVRLLDDIDDDLNAAAAAIPGLPSGCRRAVALAHGLFAELSRRLRVTPANTLVSSRVRVPNPVKLRIAAVVVARGGTP